MPTFTTLTSRVVSLPLDDIDTDQIIPARYLKTTDKNGLGKSLFSDWRYNADGSDKPDFALNKPEAKGAAVLVGGHNFGCGSSREHAPWALMGFGFQAVVAVSFADIFRSNAQRNGLLPVIVEPAVHAKIVAGAADPSFEVAIDLDAQTITLKDGTKASFPIDPFAKHCLLQGIDELGYLLSLEKEVLRYEQAKQR
jgi:3-isopropylmalate/(R)-2-methylmalate dehydratase small subunit